VATLYDQPRRSTALFLHIFSSHDFYFERQLSQIYLKAVSSSKIAATVTRRCQEKKYTVLTIQHTQVGVKSLDAACPLLYIYVKCVCVCVCVCVCACARARVHMYTQSNKNPSVRNFLSPKPEVTCGTVAIIIRVVLLSPYLRIRGVSLFSIHCNQSHRLYMNRRQQYICLI
jgi:hypothetical protein